MSEKNVLSTKEVLLDHLYAVISPLAPSHADRIVGMFVDSSERELMVLLGDQHLLQKTVDQAVSSLLKCQVGSPDADTSDLGDELFHKVAQTEPQLCSQITGMLLELDPPTIHRLLKDDTSLDAAITKAKHELLSHPHGPGVSESLAERLYEAVSEIYQKNAPKIAGMLSEQSEDELVELMESPSKFKASVEACRHALKHTEQWIYECS